MFVKGNFYAITETTEGVEAKLGQLDLLSTVTQTACYGSGSLNVSEHD